MTEFELVEFLQKFASYCVTINKPVEELDYKAFESKYELNLPIDFKRLLKLSNGFGLFGVEVFGMNANDPIGIEQVYEYEHKVRSPTMPKYLVPFSPDGAGNHYCFDTMKANGDSCWIVFWEGRYSYSNNDLPEVTHKTFREWVMDIIVEETLKNYDFNGNDLP